MSMALPVSAIAPRRLTPAAALAAALVVLLATPLLLPLDAFRQDLANVLAPPSLAEPLGTDQLGRSVLARLLHGARYSLGIAAASVVLVATGGVLLGLVAALAPRGIGAAIMRLCDVMLAFPALFAALLAVALLGGGMAGLLVAISIGRWPPFCRMSNAIARAELAEPHVEAARLAGFSRWYILTRHLLRPVAVHTAPLAAMAMAGAVMAISALGYIGIGLRPPTPEWGAMLSELAPFLALAPVQTLAPSALIVATMLACLALARRLAPARPLSEAERP